MLALQGILSSCLFHTLTRDLVKCVGNTGNPLKLFISYLNERSCKMCWHYRESSRSCFVHTLTRDLVKCVDITGNPLELFISYLLVKCVGITGNPLKLFISYLTRDLVKCVGITGNPLKLFISYLNERSCKMCWHYRESSQVVYFIL